VTKTTLMLSMHLTTKHLIWKRTNQQYQNRKSKQAICPKRTRPVTFIL